MKNYTVINDTHVGTLRAAGTTDASSRALRMFSITKVAEIFEETHNDVIVNGDLFDGFQIPLADALAVLKTITKWLERGHRLFLLPGNHDLSSDSSKLSTFEFISQVLSVNPKVQYLRGGGWIDEEDGVYGISHVVNQDVFDYELAKVPECQYLLLHCNWDNGFAKEMDHSLNLDAKVAEKLPAKKIIMGHEHGGGVRLSGKVEIAGNPFPTSIADCLSGSKHVLSFGDLGVTYRKSWDSSNFAVMDWREVSNVEAQFIRVTGTATAEEAALAVDAVAKLRRTSQAFVVGGAVKTASDQQTLDMAEALASVEDVRAFDVMGELKSRLSKEQVELLENLK